MQYQVYANYTFSTSFACLAERSGWQGGPVQKSRNRPRKHLFLIISCTRFHVPNFESRIPRSVAATCAVLG